MDQPWGTVAELIPNASEYVDLAPAHDDSLVRHQPRLQTNEIYCFGTEPYVHEGHIYKNKRQKLLLTHYNDHATQAQV